MSRLLNQPPDGEAATSVTRRFETMEPPLRLVAEFDGGPYAASTASDAVRAAAVKWGISRIADSAEHLTFMQAAWLMAHDHPADSCISVHAEYDRSRRKLLIVVGDSGTMLPAFGVGDAWRSSLPGARELIAYRQGPGRRLSCVVQMRAPWRLRMTWDRKLMGENHPEFTFDESHSQHRARRMADLYLPMDGVRAVEWQGPGDRDDQWHEHATLATATSS